jgi:uncharacterized protein (TIGR03437 family)
MRLFLILLAVGAAYGQRPVISPGGVVNAASYATGGPSGKAVAGGSIVSVFGRNLATVTQSASALPLPTSLGGTSVTVNGIAAPLFFVSPGQINLQLPSSGRYPISSLGFQMVVTTPAGASDPYPLDLVLGEGFGIFTLDGSGCGPGAVLNLASDGSMSLNSPSSSASPGDFISVYGTGLVGFYNAPPDGSPAPSNPPSLAMSWSLYQGAFDLPPSFPPSPLDLRVSWAGRAPGFVGLDQVNVRIPDAVRDGCGVPLMIETTGGLSQPIPVSIRKGGGVCVDPPTAGYGQITWDRTVASGTTAAEVTETFTAAFPASPGKQPPPQVEFRPGGGFSRVIESFGPSCPLPGYTNLDAGSVTIEGPSFGPVEAAPAAVDRQRVYRAALPNGTIRPGSFTVKASGGSEVGPFQSSLRIGSGISVTSSFPPGTVVRLAASGGPLGLTANWTGGDPDAWVTLKVVSHQGVCDVYSFLQARASSGTATIGTGGLPPGRGEIILEVAPDPAQVPALSAPGLSLGGQHLWKYTYRFGGLTLQ